MSGLSTQVEVFYSYAHEDETFRNTLEKHLSLLRRQGLITAWHDRHILPGTDWSQAINEHLERASVILLLISADFLASDYCYGLEMQRALQRHQANEALVIPILLRPVDWNSAPFAHLQALPTDAKPITKWRNQDEAFADVATGIRRVIEDLSSLEVSAPRAALPPIWNVPYPRNSFFIGREELLTRLRTQLQVGQATALSQPQAITGLGGIGKTQIAVEYAYRFHQDYQVVLWARAENIEALTSSYVTIASLLNLPEQLAQDQTITVNAVKVWLQRHSEWLLMLDNADELSIVGEFLPQAFQGHLLLTTRASAVSRLAKRIEVDILDLETGALLMLRRAGVLDNTRLLDQAEEEDRELARQLCKELGGLPLALDQAGAFIEETQCGLQEYLRLYHLKRAEVLKLRGEGVFDDHPKPVATTWSLSFAAVEQRQKAAADLLRACTFLHPDAIPEELFGQGVVHLGPVLAAFATNPLTFNTAIATLNAYSLLRRNSTEKTLLVHRLVQAVLQDTMSEQERDLWRERVVMALDAVFPNSEPTTWIQCERLVPHALVCATSTQSWKSTNTDLASLLLKTANYLVDRAQYEQAEPLYQRSLLIRERAYGPEHPDVATPLNGLAIIYREQGKYEQAEPLFQRALLIREQALGSDHPKTAEVMYDFALLQDAQGNRDEGKSLYEQALAIRVHVLGDNHPKTRETRKCYITLLQTMGRYEEAALLEANHAELGTSEE